MEPSNISQLLNVATQILSITNGNPAWVDNSGGGGGGSGGGSRFIIADRSWGKRDEDSEFKLTFTVPEE